MTDKIDTLFQEINTSLNDYSSTSETLIKNIKSDIEVLDKSITSENNKIDSNIQQFRPIQPTIPVSGGNNTFLSPSQLQSTYKKIKMSGGSKQDIINMIYTIEKMKNMGIHRDFFPKLLHALKKISK
jgi:hypothetical protein